MWQPTDVKMDQNKEIKSGGSGELQSAVYTFCCRGMMKYWNIELDILHGQQAFISAKSVPCVTRPALVLSRGVTETGGRGVPSTWWALFKVRCFFFFTPGCCRLCALRRKQLSVDRSLPSQRFHSFSKMTTFLIMFYSEPGSNPHNISLTSLDISFSSPKTTTERPS